MILKNWLRSRNPERGVAMIRIGAGGNTIWFHSDYPEMAEKGCYRLGILNENVVVYPTDDVCKSGYLLIGESDTKLVPDDVIFVQDTEIKEL